MNRIDKLFSEKKKDVLAVYFTAGFPANENATDTAATLAEAGVDLVEVGMPFSDPLADGPVIQESSSIALKNGMNIARLFAELKSLRSKTSVPVVLMGYLNPVMQFGVERFLAECSSCGVDGVILPDLPIEEYVEVYKALFEKYNVYPVFLVTPSTPNVRLQLIASHSKGFVYVVSTSSTTGTRNEIDKTQREQLKSVLTSLNGIPTMVGFGIHDQSTFQGATEHAAGGIVGTAFIREVKATGSSATAIEKLMKKLKPEVYDHPAI